MLNEEENITYKDKIHQTTRHTIGPGGGQFTAEVIKNPGATELSNDNIQYSPIHQQFFKAYTIVSPIHIILSLITLTILQI